MFVCVWFPRRTVQHPSVHLAPRDTPPDPAPLPGVPVTQHGDQQQEQQRGRSGSRPPALPQQLEAGEPRLLLITIKYLYASRVKIYFK